MARGRQGRLRTRRRCPFCHRPAVAAKDRDAYVGHADQRDAEIAKALTIDEARRVMLCCEFFGTADLIGEGG
jgi:hypothetical protein